MAGAIRGMSQRTRSPLYYKELSGRCTSAAKTAGETLKEIRAGSADTHELAVQAKNQADRTKDLADRALLQANATSRIAKLTQDTLSVSQQAYVTVGKQDGTVADFVMPDDPRNNAGIVIYLRNSGHMPAKFNWGMLYPIVTIPPTPDLPQLESVHKFNNLLARTRNRKAKNGSVSETGGEIIAGDSFYVADVVELPQERYIRQIKANRLFMLTGAFEYCDALGNYMCRQFMMFYQGEPFKRFSLGGEYECPAFLHKIEHPDPNLEYLAPCETLSEREQNAKPPAKKK